MSTLNAIAADPAANAYVTRAYAVDYLTTRRIGVADTFIALSGTLQDAVIMHATLMLDLAMDWDGAPRTLTQRLRLPRSGLYTKDGMAINYDTIPSLVQDATVELANSLSQRERMLEPELVGLGFREASVGPLKVIVDPKMILPYIPDFVILMLSPLGTPYPEASRSAGTVKLVRT